MSATTLIAPSPEEALEQRHDAEHLLPRNGNGGAQSTQPAPSASELEKLDEAELKAAIKFAWKKHERLAKKDMGPLLFWLRLRLRAQGSRNDIHDKDRGFGSWVEDNLDISRATADRWADEYGLATGFMTRDLTSPHVRKSCDNPRFYGDVMRKHGKAFTFWVSQPLHRQYEQAMKTIKHHFNTDDSGDAVVKGLCYAAKALATQSKERKRRK
jgi:hypothetical protein